MQTLCQIWKDEGGMVAAEYAILLGFIAVALIASLTTFRGAVENAIGNAANAISS
jgi:Flp pilus assembly pilin Flp